MVGLLKDTRTRTELPGVMWRDPILKTPITGGSMGAGYHLAPDIDSLPFVDRRFLVDDPYRANDGRIEANMVGARGCPYDCSFCGAAISANPEITIRTRTPENIITEMHELDARYGVTAFRFVDDLFLGYARFIERLCQVHDLWDITEGQSGRFRASVFEFRPYPGTPEWHRLLATGRTSQ